MGSIQNGLGRSVNSAVIYLPDFIVLGPDSAVAIRRRVSFMINFLLLPTMGATSNQHGNQNGPALHTPTSEPSQTSQSPAPVTHPNSHASIVSDPSSANTSTVTLKAMREKNVLGSVIAALVDSQVHQVQENCVRCVYIILDLLLSEVSLVCG